MIIAQTKLLLTLKNVYDVRVPQTQRTIEVHIDLEKNKGVQLRMHLVLITLLQVVVNTPQ